MAIDVMADTSGAVGTNRKASVESDGVWRVMPLMLGIDCNSHIATEAATNDWSSNVRLQFLQCLGLQGA